VNDRPSEPPADARPIDAQVADTLLARALRRAWWTILWERLWPALASLAVAIGIFLAASWAGLWLVLPPLGRAVALFVLVVLIAVAAVPLFRFRLPSTFDGLRRLDRGSGLAHRPATALADELAAGDHDQVSLALWRAHVEQALRAANALKAGTPRPRLPTFDPVAVRALVVLLVCATFFAASGERVKRITAAFDWAGVVQARNFRVDAWVTPKFLADPAGHPRRRAASGCADPDRADRQRAGHPRKRREPARSGDERRIGRGEPRRRAGASRRYG